MKKFLLRLVCCFLVVSLVSCTSGEGCDFCGENKKCEKAMFFGEEISVCEDCIKEIHGDYYTSSNSQTPSVKEIEITLDNWDTYFEFTTEESEYINKYNEIEHIQHRYLFSLKEEYVLADEGTSINLEYGYKGMWYSVQEDLANKEIVWGESLGSEKTETNEIEIVSAKTSIAGEWFMISGQQKRKCWDFEVLRIYGTLSIVE